MISRVQSLENINQAVVRKRTTFVTEALDGGEILTDYVLDLYRHWFEDALPRAGVRAVNLTGAGAKIAGMERPADLLAFVNNLPLRDDPARIFAATRPPEIFDHSLNRDFFADLGKLVKTKHADANAEDQAVREFFARYPYLEFLNRRAAVYVERNRAKLTDEKADLLQRENRRKGLGELYRGVRGYLGF